MQLSYRTDKTTLKAALKAINALEKVPKTAEATKEDEIAYSSAKSQLMSILQSNQDYHLYYSPADGVYKLEKTHKR